MSADEYLEESVTSETEDNSQKNRDSVVRAERVFKNQFRVALLTVIIPILSLGVLFYIITNRELSYFYLALWALMHFVGMAGISVGFHRLASHNSFAATKWTKRVLLIMGSMSAQGPVLYWATNHRRHHHKCDKPGDVHSPYFNEVGGEYKNKLVGLLHAHTGWMFKSNPSNPVRYSMDLLRDTDVIFVNKHYYKWVTLGIVLPGLLSFSVFHSLESFLTGMLIGGLVRINTVQHVTWAINSLTHMFGKKPYKNRDHSTNLFWLSIPTAGESWHNNHHAFPYSSRLGLLWWQIDPGWMLLKTLHALGLVSDLKIPSKKRINTNTEIEAVS